MSAQIYQLTTPAALDENRTVQLPLKLQKAVMTADFSGTEHCVIQAIIFLTFGHDVQSVKTTAKRLAGLLRRSDKLISRILKSLKDRCVIHHASGKYSINTDVESWCIGGRSASARERSKMMKNQPAGSQEETHKTVEQKTEDQPAGRQEKTYSGIGKASENQPAGRCLYKSNNEKEDINKKRQGISGDSTSTDVAVVSSDPFLVEYQQKQPSAAIAKRSKTKVQWGTTEDLMLANQMHDQISQITMNGEKSDSRMALWADEVRLLAGWLISNHPDRVNKQNVYSLIQTVFNWANTHQFWSANVLSPGKLRDKWPTLAAQMQQERLRAKAAHNNGNARRDGDSDSWGGGIND